MNKKVRLIRLGHIDYVEAWNYQRKLFEYIIAQKKRNASLPPVEKLPTSNYLLCCEHPHVFTLGRNGNSAHLLMPKQLLAQQGIGFHHVERGGDITYHGPGQLVIYPIIDLENFFTDIRRYMRLLEGSVINTLEEYNIHADRIEGLTGVWIKPHANNSARKICALGVKTSRWVTLHGLALNVRVNLKYFDYIVPCGIKDHAVTSMEKELNAKQDVDDVALSLIKHISALFQMEIVEQDAPLQNNYAR